MWEWSHSAEAYQNVRDNIAGKDRHWLEVVYAEWKAAIPDRHGGFSSTNMDERKYEKFRKKAVKIPDDILADYIWERAEELATCTNGGWEAWCCPYGCGCHMVPFDSEAEIAEKEKQRLADEEDEKEWKEVLDEE